MSARDVIDFTLMGRHYHGTEGTANAILSALRDAGYAVVQVPPPIDYIDPDNEEEAYQGGWNDCRNEVLRCSSDA